MCETCDLKRVQNEMNNKREVLIRVFEECFKDQVEDKVRDSYFWELEIRLWHTKIMWVGLSLISLWWALKV